MEGNVNLYNMPKVITMEKLLSTKIARIFKSYFGEPERLYTDIGYSMYCTHKDKECYRPVLIYVRKLDPIRHITAELVVDSSGGDEYVIVDRLEVVRRIGKLRYSSKFRKTGLYGMNSKDIPNVDKLTGYIESLMPLK